MLSANVLYLVITCTIAVYLQEVCALLSVNDNLNLNYASI